MENKMLNKEEIEKARKEVLSIIETPDYVTVKRIPKENIIIERTQQETCVELIASGERPIAWLLIKNGEILSGWGYPNSFWSVEQFCENFNISKNDYYSPCFDDWEYWGSSNSPYIPAFRDLSTHSNERGEVRYGEDSDHDFNGYIDNSFNFSNAYLYVEYEWQDEENSAEIYILEN
ncbi:hypothetical protein NL50_17480 [Clostridium acetobutylicum]|nr:hypothetical protein NL50_17480 [Clostridium acetobutylicum]